MGGFKKEKNHVVIRQTDEFWTLMNLDCVVCFFRKQSHVPQSQSGYAGSALRPTATTGGAVGVHDAGASYVLVTAHK